MSAMDKIVTVFPKGTIVKYNGEPCELLADTPYFSARIQTEVEAGNETSIPRRSADVDRLVGEE